MSLEGLHPRFDLLYYFPVPTCHFTVSTCLSRTCFQGSFGLDFYTKTDFCVTSQLYINRNSKVLEDRSKKFMSNPLLSLKFSYFDLILACDGMDFFLFPRCYLTLSYHCRWRLALEWLWERHWIPTLYLPVKIGKWYYTSFFFKWCTRRRCFPSSGLPKLVILAWGTSSITMQSEITRFGCSVKPLVLPANCRKK